jgi:hypothetical protein
VTVGRDRIEVSSQVGVCSPVVIIIPRRQLGGSHGVLATDRSEEMLYLSYPETKRNHASIYVAEATSNRCSQAIIAAAEVGGR